MKKLVFLVCFLSYCLTGFSFFSVSFIGSLPEAKYKAATEGKLYMVKFTANWCMPCKWMDKNTFSDSRVQTYIGSNYVPVSIDVDDFDGMVIKQQYEVQVLPTIIIFNSKGEEVSRFEESLGPSRLLSILEEYNVPANNIKTHAVKPAAKEEVIVEESPPLIISRPHLPKIVNKEEVTNEVSEKTIETKVENIIVNPVENTELIITEVVIEDPNIYSNEPKVVTEQPYSNPVYTVPSQPTTPKVERSAEALAFLTGQGIFEIDVTFQQKVGYSIQVGVFQEYNNVLAEVNKFKTQYGERVFVHIDKHNGTTVYRLLIGHFQDSQFAETKKIGLEANGVICYVRNLKQM